MFPLLSMLMEKEPQSVGLIYIAPIKALLNNQAERLGMYTEMVGLRRFLWHGDVKDSDKRKFIKEPAAVLMTTPESLEVMLLSARVPHAKLFRDLRAVVIDEIHALAGSDRGTHLLSVLERIARHTPNDIQRIGLSATVGNPEEILAWLQSTSKRAGSVIDPPKQPSPKDLRVYLRTTTMAIAQNASRKAAGKKSLFFCESRSLAEDIAEQVVNIFEACNFQDITGQRITKVVQALQFIDERVAKMMDIWGGANDLAAFAPEPEEAEGDEALLNGPALEEHHGHASQDDIDALFA